MFSKKATVLQERAKVDFTLHDGRRIVQTALENAGCPNNWIKKVKGRKCSGEEAPYSKPNIEQLRQKYREALPDLEFLSEADSTIRGKIEELSAKAAEKDQIIESLVQNKSREREELGVLLTRLLALEKKLGEKET
jgi:hypothetical protein